jgi:acyl-CoA synthetase (NDP forming)
MNLDHFEHVFNPRSIAVIGASNDPIKFGGRYYYSLKERGHRGKLFAVNPSVTEVDGDKSYARVQEIPDEIDFAVVAVPAPFVVQAVNDCAEKGVRVVEILTAGFAESGTEEGRQWEQQMTDIARRNGMRIIGPNCFGVYNPESALSLLPGPDFPREAGPLALLSQSGGVGSFLVRKAMGLGIRFSKVISYGNACDLNEIDFLSYFQDDEQTRVVAAYIEGIKDGPRFLQAVKQLSRRKPLILWKGGLTALGSRAVASHTASLGGSKAIWDGFFRQTGAVPAVGMDELLDLIIGFLCLPDFRAERVSVVGGGGAITVAACDALEHAGLSITEFPPETQAALRRNLPPTGNSVRNPVDMGTPVYMPFTLRPALEIVAASDVVEAVIVEQWVSNYMPTFVQELAEVITSVRNLSQKPFVVTMPEPSTSADTMDIEETRRKYREYYLAHGVPVFDSLQRAANVLGKILKHNK